MNKQTMGGHRRPIRSKNVKNHRNQGNEPEKPRTEPDGPLEQDTKSGTDMAGRRKSLNQSTFLFNPGRQDSIVSLLNNYQTNGSGSGPSGTSTIPATADLLKGLAPADAATKDVRLDSNAPSYYMNHRDLVMYPGHDNTRQRSDSVFLPPPLGLARPDEVSQYPARNNSIFSSMIQMPSERSSERGSAGGPEFDWRQQLPHVSQSGAPQVVQGQQPQNPAPVSQPSDRRASKPSFDMSLWESLNIPSGSIAGLPISTGSLSGILAGINSSNIDFSNMTNAERRDSILKLLEQAPEQQQVRQKPRPTETNLKEDIFSHRKVNHDEAPENIAPDLISPDSSGSTKSMFKDEPQSPGSSPQYSMRAPSLSQPTQDKNRAIQEQLSNQSYVPGANQYPAQGLVQNANPRQQLLSQFIPPNMASQGLNGQQPLGLDMYDYKRLQPYPYQQDNSLLETKSQVPKEIPAQQMAKSEDGHPLLGATKVDQLMLVLQARDKGVNKEIRRAPDGSILVPGEGDDLLVPEPVSLVGGLDRQQANKDDDEDEEDKSKGKKKAKSQTCPYCDKTFTQSTHLEVHVRSHIGYKPYECTYCHKRFTQGGNLRTHLRLHTGEKPFACDICKRSFSRKGNLEMHKLTHEKLKPFQCRLDDCGKSFTQLGNLKSHQNRFHLDTLNALTKKVAELSGSSIEKLPREERDLLNYFKDLYKNSNKGIRGRGKRTPATNDSKISSAPVGGLTNVQFQDGAYDMNVNYQ